MFALHGLLADMAGPAKKEWGTVENLKQGLLQYMVTVLVKNSVCTCGKLPYRADLHKHHHDTHQLSYVIPVVIPVVTTDKSQTHGAWKDRHEKSIDQDL